MESQRRAPSRRRDRATIADVAALAGVTPGAVSRAVNGKPGVSDETRTRILSIVDDLDWRPNHAARSLRGQRSDTVGLVVTRPVEVVGEEVFFVKLIAGVQSVMSRRGYSLTLQIARDLDEESAIHKRWIADGRVDGMFVVDPRDDDPRIGALASTELPTVVIGGTEEDTSTVVSLRTDEARLTRTVLDHLTGLGHERIGYVTGDQGFGHIRRRVAAFNEYSLAAGVWGMTIAADFDSASAKSATVRLLAAPAPPTAIVYDSEVMAIAGLATLAERGVAVPGRMSVVSWEDSATCRVLHPTLSALDRDAVGLGRLAGTEMLHLIAHEKLVRPTVDAAVIARESTAPPPGALALLSRARKGPAQSL